jgi:hypothetical protein
MTTVVRSPPTVLQFFGNNGLPLIGGTLLTQVGGVNTATYQDAAGTIPLPNPIPLNSRGEISNASGVSTELWLISGTVYTFTLYDALGNQVGQYPNISGTIDATTLAAPTGSGLVGFQQSGTGAVARTVLSKERDIIHIEDYNAKFDGFTDDTGAWRNALAAANGRTLRLPGGVGLTSIVSASLTLPRSIRIVGETRRGVLDAPNTIGSGILSAFAGPVFTASPGSLTSYDVLLEGFTITGNNGLYGAGNGISLTNIANATLRNLVVSAFGTNNIYVDATSNHVYIRDVYAATAINANFRIDGANCSLNKAVSDGGAYSLQIGNTAAMYVSVSDCHFEGATTAGIAVSGGDNRIENNQIFPGSGADGISVIAGPSNQSAVIIVGNSVLGANTNLGTGIKIASPIYEYKISANKVVGFATAASVNDGFACITGNNLNGQTTGLSFTGGSFWAVVVGNMIAGPTNSLLHNSGNTAMYLGNRFDNGAGSYKAPTISSGNPIIIGQDGGNIVLNPTGNDILWGKALVGLGGGAAPTLGTIGGSGPTTATQNSWMRVVDSTGNAFWTPVWK